MIKRTFLLFVLFILLAPWSSARADGLYPGATVWTEGGSRGTVEAIFPDGMISVKIGFSNYQYNQNQLAVVGCYRRMCSEDKVITNGGSVGIVNGVFPRGKFSIRIGFSNYTYSYEHLANGSRNPRRGDLLIGDTVWTKGGSQGSVNGFFPDQTVSVRIGFSNYQYPRQDLAAQGCCGEICNGDSVITRGGSRGSVNGVFPSCEVSVKIGFSNYVYAYGDLGKTYP